MDHNLILEVDGKKVRITKAYKMWEFDNQEGDPAEMFTIKLYSLESAIKEYVEYFEGMEEVKSE